MICLQAMRGVHFTPIADINRDIRPYTGSNARSSTRPWKIIEWWMFSGEAIIVL